MFIAEKYFTILSTALLLMVSTGAYGEWYQNQSPEQNPASSETSHEQMDQNLTSSDTLNPEIDILPEDANNKFNPKQESSLNVAILGSSDFDISTIDTNSIELDKIPANSNIQIVDSNKDGFKDLLVEFPVADMKLDKGFVELTLIGKTKDGKEFESNGMIYITAAE